MVAANQFFCISEHPLPLALTVYLMLQNELTAQSESLQLLLQQPQFTPQLLLQFILLSIMSSMTDTLIDLPLMSAARSLIQSAFILQLPRDLLQTLDLAQQVMVLVHPLYLLTGLLRLQLPSLQFVHDLLQQFGPLDVPLGQFGIEGEIAYCPVYLAVHLVIQPLDVA